VKELTFSKGRCEEVEFSRRGVKRLNFYEKYPFATRRRKE
jgi:hypothetical protein